MGEIRILSNVENKVMFSDVMGLEEEVSELSLIADLVKDYESYTQKGIEFPKGIILHGKPGTGKTLLARAMANETNVPFYPIMAGSIVYEDEDTALNRVKEVFDKAVENSPSIIFIDEIDLFLESGGLFTQGNNEFMNQLLSLMDGHYQSTGVMVIATTTYINDISDSLLRPGRFDKKIHLTPPNISARKSMVEYFTKNHQLHTDLTIDRAARILVGSTGAEIKYLINEAALKALRETEGVIKVEHLQQSLDRHRVGLQKRDQHVISKDTERVAIHEVSHTLAIYKTNYEDSFNKVTIIPTTEILGYAQNDLTEDQEGRWTPTIIKKRIVMLLAGIAGEHHFYGEHTIESTNDIKLATDLATSMVEQYGMSNLPIRSYIGMGSLKIQGTYSEELREKVDKEISRILDEAYHEALAIVENNHDLLVSLKDQLLENETLTKEEVDYIIEEFET